MLSPEAEAYYRMATAARIAGDTAAYAHAIREAAKLAEAEKLAEPESVRPPCHHHRLTRHCYECAKLAEQRPAG